MKVGDILILLIRKTEVQFSVGGGIPVSDASVLSIKINQESSKKKSLCVGTLCVSVFICTGSHNMKHLKCVINE